MVPIISLYKTQVRKIAEFLGVPENIVSKKSSPHLWKEHFAEKELGAEYEEIDSILYCLFDKKLSLEDTANQTNISIKTVEKIYQLYQNSEHKRVASVKPFGESL